MQDLIKKVNKSREEAKKGKGKLLKSEKDIDKYFEEL